MFTVRRRLLIAAVLVAALIFPAASRASAPRSFYGVMAATDPSAQEAAWMGASGVRTLRINLTWASVQPASPNQYDWTHYDQVIGDAARSGIRVLATVYGSPSWVAPSPNYPPTGSNITRFRAFVSAAAARYGSHGTFWAEHPDIPRLPVTWWQLWNEVSSPTFWGPAPNAGQYVRLLRVFHGAVKSADPRARILLAGLLPLQYRPYGIPFARYLQQIYKRGAARYFDAAAIHPYGATPSVTMGRIRLMRKLMDGFGDARTPIWVTEIGWASAGSPSQFTVSPLLQASYLTETFRELAKARKRLRLAGAIWFSFRDGQGTWWGDNSGLVTDAFVPKLSFYAFTSLTLP